MDTSEHLSQKKIKNWWITLLLGVFYIFLGSWILRKPLEIYVLLSHIFSAVIVLSGIFWIAFSLIAKEDLPVWGWFLVGGVLELVIGTFLIMHPTVYLTILPFFIGFWLLVGGIMGIGSSLLYKSLGGPSWGWFLGLGILTVLYSILLIANPIFAGISIVFMTSFSLITLGIYKMVFAFKVRMVHKSVKHN